MHFSPLAGADCNQMIPNRTIRWHKVTFYSFAEFFLNHGCENALYLDGFVSEMYLPESKLRKTGGTFGVIIGVTSELVTCCRLH